MEGRCRGKKGVSFDEKGIGEEEGREGCYRGVTEEGRKEKRRNVL